MSGMSTYTNGTGEAWAIDANAMANASAAMIPLARDRQGKIVLITLFAPLSPRVSQQAQHAGSQQHQCRRLGNGRHRQSHVVDAHPAIANDGEIQVFANRVGNISQHPAPVNVAVTSWNWLSAGIGPLVSGLT